MCVCGVSLLIWVLCFSKKSKKVETTQAELSLDNSGSLPPLMNPAMLEASEDLTNLSHLNEPAGMARSLLVCWVSL